MPVYEYVCPECETYFTELKRVSDFNSQSHCPECNTIANKVISAPRLNIMRQEIRHAHATNERSANEPKVKHICGAHCSHDHHKKQSKSQPEPAYKQQLNRRPWMLGH